MTDKKAEALKLALEALRPLNYDQAFNDEIVAIREALMSVPDGADHTEQHLEMVEQPAQQEPVAEVRCDDGGNLTAKFHVRDLPLFAPLYTSPPIEATPLASQSQSDVKPWVGLTEEEIHKMTVLMGINPEWKAEIEIVRSIVRNLEAKLKEKNA